MSKTKAIVLEDGEVISQKYMDQYAIKNKSSESNQIPSDRFLNSYSDDQLVTPLYNPEALTQLLELNTHHYRAVKTKARDTAGLGWYLEPQVDKPSEEQKDIAEDFFENPNPSMTFNEINNQVMVDFEAIGYACFEVIRLDDENVQLEHLPSHTLRVAHDFNRFCQIRGSKKAWFKRFGYEGDIDVRTGEEKKDIPDEYKASEIIYLMNYTSRSDFYGIPDILPALGSVLAEMERQEYNISFFDNHAIPAYAVTVTGADLDEETEKTIKKFFQHDVKKSNHSTLVLTASKDEDNSSSDPVEIKFEALSTDTKEASFRMFRQDNRDEILSAHGVPPYRAGITVEGQLGGSSASEATEIYKQSIINPKQEMLENIFNRRILTEVFGVTDWKLCFKQIDTRDVDKEIDRMDKLFNMGVYSPNMILEKLGEERIDDPNMDRHFVNGMPLDTSEQETQAIMNSLKNLHEKMIKIATKSGNDET
ncbi:phage portal protein [Gracilibacillus sp. D59]|uniref:phage portal protein n=1 Tax=Gracilibacillus sp. D59 TaxID=3457434 RepID=UPI003FCD1CB6